MPLRRAFTHDCVTVSPPRNELVGVGVSPHVLNTVPCRPQSSRALMVYRCFACAQLHRNRRNNWVLLGLAADAVMIAAPMFIARTPWASFLPLKPVARLVALAGVQSFTAWLVLFLLLIAVCVVVAIAAAHKELLWQVRRWCVNGVSVVAR